MAFALPGAKTFGEVTLESVLQAARHIGLPETAARRIVREVVTRVQKEFARVSERHAEIEKIGPAQRTAQTGQEALLLRVVRHMTLKDMLHRLRDGEESA